MPVGSPCCVISWPSFNTDHSRRNTHKSRELPKIGFMDHWFPKSEVRKSKIEEPRTLTLVRTNPQDQFDPKGRSQNTDETEDKKRLSPNQGKPWQVSWTRPRAIEELFTHCFMAAARICEVLSRMMRGSTNSPFCKVARTSLPEMKTGFSSEWFSIKSTRPSDS